MIDVRKDVISSTGGQQVPWDHSALTADFYFAAVSPGAGPAAPVSKALEERVIKLEDELRQKSEAANVASSAVLMQLKQRARQLEDETRRDQQAIFQVMRDGAAEKDPAKRSRSNQEVGRLQVQIVRRGGDKKELQAEIERVEKEMGLQPGNAAAGPDEQQK